MASFVERNKLWLLPVLGAGALAVVILNIRGATSATPAADNPAQPQVEAAPAPPELPPPGAGTDLWADLKALEPVPASLAQDGPISVRAHLALGKAMDPPTLAILPGPRPLEQETRRAHLPTQVEAVPLPSLVPPPEPDFVFQGPSGKRVWIGGRPFTEGQNVRDSPYQVGRIGHSRVEILGPQGAVIRTTIPPPRQTPKAHEENP